MLNLISPNTTCSWIKSLLILEEHFNQPIRFEGQAISLFQVYNVHYSYSPPSDVRDKLDLLVGIEIGIHFWTGVLMSVSAKSR